MIPHTHEPTDDPTWQESNECHAYDPDTGVGFVTASGVFATRGSGHAYVGAFLTEDGAPVCFQRTDNDAPIVAGDRDDRRNGVSFLHWDWLDAGRGRLRVDTPDCSIDVTFTDFYEPAHWAVGPVPGAAGHVESSGTVRGTITIDGARREVDMLGHRDQSWGPRSLGALRSHAWLAGTCGPALSFTTENLVVGAGGQHAIVRAGFVVHDGGVDELIEPALVYGLDWDVRTPVRCDGALRTASGRSFTITTHRRSPTFLNVRTWPEGGGRLTATDTLFEVDCDGQRGIACLNLVTNQTAGSTAVGVLASNPLADGTWRP